MKTEDCCWHGSSTEGSQNDTPPSEESNDGASEESVRDSDSSSLESPTDDSESQSDVQRPPRWRRMNPQMNPQVVGTDDVSSSSSTNTSGQWDVFKPGNGKIGRVWGLHHQRCDLGLCSKPGVGGSRQYRRRERSGHPHHFLLFLLNILVKRGFARPDDQSGPSGTARFLQDGLSLGLSGMLGTVSGAALGLAFSASGSGLSDTFGYGTSVGGAWAYWY